MAYITSDRGAVAPALPGFLTTGLADLRSRFASYRHQRAIYLRTLRELESYTQRELHDLRLDPADFETLARQNAAMAV